MIYDGRIPGLTAAPLWSGYARLRLEDLLGLLREAGVRTELAVKRAWIASDHPFFGELKSGLHGTRETSSQIDQDHRIEGLPAILKLANAAVSAIIWRTMGGQPDEVLWARYRPKQQYSIRTAASTLAHMLATTAWLPARDGTLKRPREMTAAELAPGYDYLGNASWLDALGFGEDHRRRSDQNAGRRKAAESIGLPPEFADAFANVPADERPALIADLLQRVRERPVPPPEFPERSSANPERRARKVAENAQAAPLRTYEVRQRSVRTSEGDVQAHAKEFPGTSI